MENRQQVQVENRAQWRAWLSEHHNREEGVWLVRFKKEAGDRYVSYDEAVEEALCFGWIDSLPRKLDETRTMLWMAPRQPGSNWSRLNKERAQRMIAAGLMTPAGLAKIEAAQADGSWTALEAIENLDIPPDLEQALARYDKAREYFEAFPPSVRRGILEWIAGAKRAETRARRVAETARLAQENIRANQWRAQGK